METEEKKLSYIPKFLMIMGILNLCLMVLVAAMRMIFEADGLINGLFAYWLLSVIEPYGKMVLEIGVVSFFYRHVTKEKQKLDRSILLIWTFVIIEIQVIYYVSSNYYAKMIDTMSEFTGTAAYVSFYAGTHIFKYVMIFMSIVFAIYATGAFLSDRILIIVACVFGILYGMCFGIQSMPTIVLPDGNSIGIVVPAALFHVTQTLILFLMGLYLKLRYQKVNEGCEKKQKKESYKFKIKKHMRSNKTGGEVR